MTIKSDRWIRQQCIVPSLIKRVMVPQPQSPNFDLYFRPKPTWVLTHQSEDDLADEMAQSEGKDWGTKEFRLVTPEEVAGFKPMIEPFEPHLIRQHLHKKEFHTKDTFSLLAHPKDAKLVDRHLYPDSDAYQTQKVVSYGTSSYGYDIRCAPQFKVFTNINSTVVDPKNFDDRNYVDVQGEHCIIPPNSFALARTVEYFRIPRDVLAICLGKSTYARCGIIVNVTPLEPEWEGYLTLEFSNTTPLPAKIYAGEGCAQLLFFQSDEPCETSYKDRGGKYQGQVDQPVPPKV